MGGPGDLLADRTIGGAVPGADAEHVARAFSERLSRSDPASVRARCNKVTVKPLRASARNPPRVHRLRQKMRGAMAKVCHCVVMQHYPLVRTVDSLRAFRSRKPIFPAHSRSRGVVRCGSTYDRPCLAHCRTWRLPGLAASGSGAVSPPS